MTSPVKDWENLTPELKKRLSVRSAFLLGHAIGSARKSVEGVNDEEKGIRVGR